MQLSFENSTRKASLTALRAVALFVWSYSFAKIYLIMRPWCAIISRTPDRMFLLCAYFFLSQSVKITTVYNPKLRTFLTKVISQYTYKIHLNAILKSQIQVRSCSLLHTYCLPIAKCENRESHLVA